MQTHLKSAIPDSYKLKILKRGRQAPTPHPTAVLLVPSPPQSSREGDISAACSQTPSSTHHRTVHIPKCSLLTVENLPLYLVSLLVNPVNVIGHLKESVKDSNFEHKMCQTTSPPFQKIMQNENCSSPKELTLLVLQLA